tara:strand:- start:167 stop:2011 length:1845 start_codon:yes stop_codon:yes gene_type:complete
MKSFADFDEYKNFKEDLLLEYSIHDNKYGAGEKVVVKPPEVDTISNYLDAKIDSSTIFIKVGAIPNAIEVKVGKGSGSEVYLQIEGKPEKTWVLRGSGETIKNYFNGYKDGTGISWKADSIETAQCLGLYFDADSALKKIGKSGGTPSSSVIDSIKKGITTAFQNGEDWNGGGVGKITSKLDKISLGDMTQILGLAAGMQRFWESVGKPAIGTAHIIHSKINDYYSAEEGNPSVEVRGSKANAADCIISNVDSTVLISLMKTGKVSYDNKSICYVKDMNTDKIAAKFLQVSLKKARGGAQLGKITAMLQAKYDLPKYEVMLSTLLDEGFFSGIKDFFTGTWKKFKGFLGKVKKWVKGLATKFTKKFDRKVKGDLNDLQRVFDKMPGPKVNLKEAFVFDEQGLICEGLNQELRKLDIPKLNVVRQGIEKRLQDFSRSSKSPEFTFRKTGGLSKGDLSEEDRYKLFSNYTGVYVFNEVIRENLNSAGKLKDEMISMQKEMLFGKTTLPLWKVYGIGGDKSPWEELGGANEFESGKQTAFAGLIGAVIGFHANSQAGDYYALESSFLFGVDPDSGLPTYTLNRMGTNQGGTSFSFVFEGSSTIDSDKFISKYGKASK